MAKKSDNIEVLVRIRPYNQTEKNENTQSCIEIDQDNPKSLIFDPINNPKTFNFDYIIDQSKTQQDIYTKIGLPLSEYSLDGYNVCVFAYGQTGTGKTYTMYGKVGDEEQEGLQTRIVKNVFNMIRKQEKESQNTIQYIIKCNYFEIYNENIIDLLKEKSEENKNYQIREDVTKGVYIENINDKYIDDYLQVMDLINQGNKQRHVAATQMNLESSRSHSVFQMYLESKKVFNGVTNIKTSKINFVDLAGSERQRSTQTEGQRLKEAGSINKSLTILGRVISFLVERSRAKNKNTVGHIPYRDSKLTFLLQDSLGGNSKTVMIANITAADMSFQETLNTLKFASRAKQITNSVKKNEDTKGSIVLLRKELKIYKNKLINSKNQVEELQKIVDYCNQNHQQENQQQIESKQMQNEQNTQIIEKIVENKNIDTTNEIKENNEITQILEENQIQNKSKIGENEEDSGVSNMGDTIFNTSMMDLEVYTELQKIQQQNQELENQIIQLKKQFQHSQNENEQLEEMNQVLQKQNDSINENLEQMIITKLDDNQDRLQKNMQQLQIKQIEDKFQQQIEIIEIKNTQLQKKLEKFEQIENYLEQSPNFKLNEFSNITDVKQKWENIINDILKQNEDQKIQIIQNNTVINELKGENECYQEENDSQKNTIEFLNSQLKKLRKIDDNSNISQNTQLTGSQIKSPHRMGNYRQSMAPVITYGKERESMFGELQKLHEIQVKQGEILGNSSQFSNSVDSPSNQNTQQNTEEDQEAKFCNSADIISNLLDDNSNCEGKQCENSKNNNKIYGTTLQPVLNKNNSINNNKNNNHFSKSSETLQIQNNIVKSRCATETSQEGLHIERPSLKVYKDVEYKSNITCQNSLQKLVQMGDDIPSNMQQLALNFGVYHISRQVRKLFMNNLFEQLKGNKRSYIVGQKLYIVQERGKNQFQHKKRKTKKPVSPSKTNQIQNITSKQSLILNTQLSQSNQFLQSDQNLTFMTQQQPYGTQYNRQNTKNTSIKIPQRPQSSINPGYHQKNKISIHSDAISELDESKIIEEFQNKKIKMSRQNSSKLFQAPQSAVLQGSKKQQLKYSQIQKQQILQNEFINSNKAKLLVGSQQNLNQSQTERNSQIINSPHIQNLNQSKQNILNNESFNMSPKKMKMEVSINYSSKDVQPPMAFQKQRQLIQPQSAKSFNQSQSGFSKGQSLYSTNIKQPSFLTNKIGQKGFIDNLSLTQSQYIQNKQNSNNILNNQPNTTKNADQKVQSFQDFNSLYSSQRQNSSGKSLLYNKQQSMSQLNRYQSGNLNQINSKGMNRSSFFNSTNLNPNNPQKSNNNLIKSSSNNNNNNINIHINSASSGTDTLQASNNNKNDINSSSNNLKRIDRYSRSPSQNRQTMIQSVSNRSVRSNMSISNKSFGSQNLSPLRKRDSNSGGEDHLKINKNKVKRARNTNSAKKHKTVNMHYSWKTNMGNSQQSLISPVHKRVLARESLKRLSVPKFYDEIQQGIEETDQLDTSLFDNSRCQQQYVYQNIDYKQKFLDEDNQEMKSSSKFEQLLKMHQSEVESSRNTKVIIKRNLKKIFENKKSQIFTLLSKFLMNLIIKLRLHTRKTKGSIMNISRNNKFLLRIRLLIDQSIEMCKTPSPKNRIKVQKQGSMSELDLEKSLILSKDFSKQDKIIETRTPRSRSNTPKSQKSSPKRTNNASSFQQQMSSNQNKENNTDKSQSDSDKNSDEMEDEDEDQSEEDDEYDSDDDDDDDDIIYSEEDAKPAQLSDAMLKAAGIAVQKKPEDQPLPKEIKKQVIFQNSLLKWGMFDITFFPYDKKAILEFQTNIVMTIQLPHLQALIDIIAHFYQKMNIHMSQLVIPPQDYESNTQNKQKMADTTMYHIEYTVQKIIDYLNYIQKNNNFQMVTRYLNSIDPTYFGQITLDDIVEYIENCEYIRNIIDFQEQDDNRNQKKKQTSSLIPETLQMYEDSNSHLVLIETIGAGSFGQVNCYYDLDSKTYSAIKKFAREQDFKREYLLYEYIKQLELTGVFLDQIGVSEQEQYIIMKRGQCDFEKFIELRNEAGIPFDWNEILYVFSRFIYLIKQLHSKNLIFSDLKPENVILDFDDDRENYLLYLIDIGSVYIEETDNIPEDLREQYMFGTTMLSTFFFPPFWMRKYQLTKAQCDIYTLGRSMQVFLNPKNEEDLNENDLKYKEVIPQAEMQGWAQDKKLEHELKVLEMKKEYHDSQINKFLEKYSNTLGKLKPILKAMLIDVLEDNTQVTIEGLYQDVMKLYTKKNMKFQYLTDQKNLVRKYLEQVNEKKKLPNLTEYELQNQLSFFEQNNLYQKQLQILKALEEKLEHKKIESQKQSNFLQIKEIQNENKKRQTSLIICQNKMGKVYNYLGKYNESYNAFERSVINSEKLYMQNNIIHQIYLSSQRNMGLIQRKRGLFEEAIKIFKHCFKLLSEGNYPLELETNHCMALNNSLAKVYIEQQNDDIALKLLEQSLQIKEKYEKNPKVKIDEKMKAQCYSLLGSVYFKANNIVEAEKFHKMSLAINKSERNKYYAKDLNNLAVIYKAKKEYEKVEKNLTKALKIQRELYGNNHVELAQAMQTLSHLKVETGQFDDALEYQKKNLDAQKEQIRSKYNQALGQSFKDIGITELEKGNFQDAKKNLKEAYTHFSYSLGADDDLTLEMEIYFGSKIYQKAVQKLQQQDYRMAFDFFHRSLNYFVTDDKGVAFQRFQMNDNTIAKDVIYYEPTRVQVNPHTEEVNYKCCHMLPAIKNMTSNYIAFRIIKLHPESEMKVGVINNTKDQNFQIKNQDELIKRKEDEDLYVIGRDKFKQGDLLFCSIHNQYAKQQLIIENLNDKETESSNHNEKFFFQKTDNLYIYMILTHPGDEIEVITNQMGNIMSAGQGYVINNHLELGKLNDQALLKRRARYHYTQALWMWLYRYRECQYFFLKMKKSREIFYDILKQLKGFNKYTMHLFYVLNDPLSKVYQEELEQTYFRSTVKVQGTKLAPYDYYCYRIQFLTFTSKQFKLFQQKEVYDNMNNKLPICVQFFNLKTCLYYIQSLLHNHHLNIFGVQNWISVARGGHKQRIIDNLQGDKQVLTQWAKNMLDILIADEDATGLSYQDFVIGDNIQPFQTLDYDHKSYKNAILTNQIQQEIFKDEDEEEQENEDFMFVNDMTYDIKLPQRYINLYTHNVFFENSEYTFSYAKKNKDIQKKAIKKLQLSVLCLIAVFANKIIDAEACKIRLEQYQQHLKNSKRRKKSVGYDNFMKDNDYQAYLQSQIGYFHKWIMELDREQCYKVIDEIFVRFINNNKPFFFHELHFPQSKYYSKFVEVDTDEEDYDQVD